jgi:hypothetical protein
MHTVNHGVIKRYIRGIAYIDPVSVNASAGKLPGPFALFINIKVPPAD